MRYKTQRENVLEHLLDGRPITPLEALNNYGAFRLAAIICQLRKEGYEIETKRITKNGARFAQYTLKGANDGRD